MVLRRNQTLIASIIVFTLALCANISLWFQVRDVQQRWANVPPAPSVISASLGGLGDTQFSYRTYGVTIQNMGDTGGRTTNLKEYDYDNLVDWFRLEDTLDPRSHFIPYLAAYYFGVIDAPEKVAPLVDYLEEVGLREGPQNWRWLGRAAFLARFNEQNDDKALKIAQEMADLENQGVKLPMWARQMPVFILQAKGEKRAAQAIVEETLKSSVDELDPTEVNFLIDYLCNRLLDESESAKHPFCQNSEEAQ